MVSISELNLLQLTEEEYNKITETQLGVNTVNRILNLAKENDDLTQKVEDINDEISLNNDMIRNLKWEAVNLLKSLG